MERNCGLALPGFVLIGYNNMYEQRFSAGGLDSRPTGPVLVLQISCLWEHIVGWVSKVCAEVGGQQDSLRRRFADVLQGDHAVLI